MLFKKEAQSDFNILKYALPSKHLESLCNRYYCTEIKNIVIINRNVNYESIKICHAVWF